MSDDIHADDERRRDLLVGQALGILDGRDRSAIIAHLDGCDQCSAELIELSSAADALTLVTPDAEPPVGFETRVMSRIDDVTAPTTTRARHRVPLAIAAAAVALALGVGSVIGALAHGTSTATTSALSARLVSGQKVVGAVYAYSGSPGWMVVAVQPTRSATRLECVVMTSHGDRSVGDFVVSGTLSSWSVALPVPLREVRGVRLTTASGSTIATTSSFADSGRYSSSAIRGVI
jgi:hypothetical protein